MGNIYHNNPYEYWCENNLLHAEMGKYSENGPLFTAYYLLYNYYFGLEENNIDSNFILKAISRISPDGRQFFANPSDGTDRKCTHFSHDNMTGLYCLRTWLGLGVEDLPVIRWNCRTWLHPRDILFYNMLKGNKWSFFFFPLLYLIFYISFSREKEITSGKLKGLLMLETLKIFGKESIKERAKKYSKSLDKVLKRSQGTDFYLSDIAKIYFKEERHPIRKLIGE